MSETEEKKAGRNWPTPVPKHDDGSVNWKQLIATWSVIVGVLGGGGGVAAMSWPFGVSHEVEHLQAQLQDREDELKTQREERLKGIETRLKAIEEKQTEQSNALRRIEVWARRGR